MSTTTDPRLVVMLPSTGLGVEAAFWDCLHQAQRRWMARTHTYTAQSVAVLHALSVKTWEAYRREDVGGAQ